MGKKQKLNAGFGVTSALIIIGVIAVGGMIAYTVVVSRTKPVACTQEGLICPDGSVVGRTGPHCEFAKCPELQGALHSGVTVAVPQSSYRPGDTIPIEIRNQSSTTLEALFGPGCGVFFELKIIGAAWQRVSVSAEDASRAPCRPETIAPGKSRTESRTLRDKVLLGSYRILFEYTAGKVYSPEFEIAARSAPVGKLKLCPDEWFENRMPRIVPRPGEQEAPRQYFILDGKRRELSEFDVGWIRTDCAVKAPTIVE